MRWGGWLSHNLADRSLSTVKKEEMKHASSDFQAETRTDYSPVSGATQVPWGLSRLFGASKSPNSPTGLTPPTRSVSETNYEQDSMMI